MGNTKSQHTQLHAMVRKNAWDEIGRFFHAASLEQKMLNLKYLNISTLADGRKDYTPVLSIAISKKAPIAIIREMILLGGKQVVMMTDCYGNTPLHIACQFNPSPILIHLLIDVGGEDLIVAKSRRNLTGLHGICYSGLTMTHLKGKLTVNAGRSTDGHSLVEIVNRMVDSGGGVLVKTKDIQNQTPLMYACVGPDLPEQAILRMIQAGGKELLLMQNNKGMTALHLSMWKGNKASSVVLRSTVIQEMINVGGIDLVTVKGELDITPLHMACVIGAPLELIQRIVDTGGVDLVLAKTISGKRGTGANVLRFVFRFGREERDWCIGAMKILIRIGGPKLILMKGDDGKTSIELLGQCTPSLGEEKRSIRDEYRRILEDALRDCTTYTAEIIVPAAVASLSVPCHDVSDQEELIPVACATVIGTITNNSPP